MAFILNFKLSFFPLSLKITVMSLYKSDQIRKAPNAQGIYCWYIIPKLYEFDIKEFEKKSSSKEKIKEFIEEKILKFFKLPNYTVRVSAPLKPTFEGEVENVQRISDKPIDLIFQNIEVVKDINSFFNLNNSCFFSPVYIGKAKRIQDRLFQHKQLISDLKNATRTIEIELSSNDVKFDTSEFAFAKEFVKRSIPLDWLYFSYCDLSNSKISESYEAIESIMNRINFPLMGRN